MLGFQEMLQGQSLASSSGIGDAHFLGLSIQEEVGWSYNGGQVQGAPGSPEFEHNRRGRRVSFHCSFHGSQEAPACGGACKKGVLQKFGFAFPTASCLLSLPPTYTSPIPLASRLFYFPRSSIEL